MNSVRTRSIGKFHRAEGVLETDVKVNREIDRAYKEYRAFSVFLNTEVIESIRRGLPEETIQNDLRTLCSGIFTELSSGDQNLLRRFETDTRLIRRIINALEFIHRACADIDDPLLISRRFVLIKERHGFPTYFHEFNVGTVISHVGSGLRWQETPSVYLGLNLFDFLSKERKSGKSDHYKIFLNILSVEERAIETGYYHSDPVPVAVSRQIQNLIEQLIRYVDLELEEITETLPADLPAFFTGADRDRLIALLDARLRDDFTAFDYQTVMSGINQLEELARKYKESSGRASLHQVVRILTAAAGHDIHEVRNRANIALERIFAPKEYDAPVATRFINVKISESVRLTFDMPEEEGVTYALKIYHTPVTDSGIPVAEDLSSEEIRLEKNENGQWETSLVFSQTGQKDFVLIRKEGKTSKYVSEWQASGRINIIPDVRGEVILEIFTDIHGHTRVYWRTNTEHPGLVYNENGEVIRLGRFSDIADHLEDLKARYHLSALYLLGVQKRGSHSEDWAAGATSPSPFSPLSLTEFEDYLGGEKEFRELTEKAHSLDIKIIIDIIPHLNRHSKELPDELAVQCYDGGGGLVYRASTDGRYGSWDDGRLLNYRMFEVWEWLAGSVTALIEKYNIDGIRFDSAHAVPIIMKRNNYPYIYDYKRSHEEMLEGRIIVNDVEYGHFITTGYYDSACRDFLAVPFHFYLMQRVEQTLRKTGKNYFINLAECYWGHERFLARSGVIPYNSALFKICENILHGKSDVREIYHIYDWYFPSVLPPGSEMLGILGNHDERRALNTFGHRGLRAAVGLTLFMSNIILDYEGSAEGEGWKVFLDNIYVNWNQFEFASNRSLEHFYREWYSFHRTAKGKGYIVWANNNYVAAAAKFTDQGIWIGAFNFSNENQAAAIQFDNPGLPLDKDTYYILEDPLYSPITGHYSHISSRELKNTKIHTVVSYTERVKLLRMRPVKLTEELYNDFFRDSFFRMCSIPESSHFTDNFSFTEISGTAESYKKLTEFIEKVPAKLFAEKHRHILDLGLKRALYYIYEHGIQEGKELLNFIDRMTADSSDLLKSVGQSLKWHYSRGSFIFLSAEAEPFSRSGGLGNVVAELPRELARLGEEMIVITGYYRHGDEKSAKKMRQAAEQHEVTFTGKTVKFYIGSSHYEVGVHTCKIEGVTYYLLDHYELFDGLYWGITAEEKLRRRIGFARAAAEVICTFGLAPNFTISNDAYTGLFNGLVRSDPNYYNNPNFHRNTYLHMVHNGGWQYFDAYHRWEKGWDHFGLFNIPGWKASDFMDPVHGDRINCMAAGIRFADRTITVSPSYARQIEHACDGLEHILHNVIGISNAIDSGFLKRIQTNFRKSGFAEEYSVKLTEHIKNDSVLEEKLRFHYPEILKGADAVEAVKDEGRRKSLKRTLNKLMVQLHHGFEVDPDIVLFSMIHRITEQKGFQLLLDASEGIFKNLKFQAIIGGAVASGDRRGEEIAHGLWLLTRFFPKQVSVNFGFQDVSVPLLASDIFCMPSMSEPGGISQLEAFATGNLVVARATGGLRDTVNPIIIEDKEVKGNGFLFSDYSAHAFYGAMERASEFFSRSGEGVIAKARQNAEESAYYWDRPARKYIKELYRVKEVIRIL